MTTKAMGVYEKLAYFINKRTAHNLVVTGEFSSNKKIDYRLAAEAYNSLISLYPAFRNRIDECSDDIQLVDSDPKSKFYYLKYENITSEELSYLIELQLNTSVDTSSSPLMKTLFFNINNEKYHIIFSYHHLLAGAVPGFYLFNTFLECLDCVINNKHIKVMPHITRPTVDDFLIEKADKNYRIPVLPKDLNIKRDVENSPISDLVTRIQRIHLSKEQTRAFLKKCSLENTSVNSVLIAASLLTLQKFILKTSGVKIKTAGASTLVNLRKPVASNIKDEEMVYFCSSFFEDYSYSDNTSIWEFSRDIRVKVKSAIKNRKYFDEYFILKELIEVRKLKQAALLESISPIKPSVCVSSLGNFCFSNDFITLKPINCHVAVSTHCYSRNKQRFLIVPQTYNKKLTILLEYGFPVISEDEAQYIMRTLLSYLEIEF